MCHAVNAGIVRAFREGVLTNSTLMACCPWFEEAAALAREHRIPVGVHLTATCDWDRFRWRPLTRVRSFVGPDGTFPATIQEVRDRADRGELEAEFRAQVEAVLARGLRVTHLDSHMGIVDAGLLQRLCLAYGIPTRNLPPETAGGARLGGLASVHSLTAHAGDKKAAFRAWLDGLADGWHAFVVHAAEDSEELRAMTSPGHPSRGWARDYRVSDLALVLDPDVGAWCRGSDVRLVSFDEVSAVRGPAR